MFDRDEDLIDAETGTMRCCGGPGIHVDTCPVPDLLDARDDALNALERIRAAASGSNNDVAAAAAYLIADSALNKARPR